MSMLIYYGGVNEANLELPALLARMDTAGSKEDSEAVPELPQSVLEQTSEEKNLDCGCRKVKLPNGRPQVRYCAGHRKMVFDADGLPEVRICVTCSRPYLVTRQDRKVCSHRCKSLKHGGSSSSEYASWESMIGRCTRPLDNSYERYGGRGIKICDRWMDYAAFLVDMGPKPTPKHTIDRFPNKKGNYEPGNCRWATSKEQNSNTSRNHYLTLDGITMTITDWAERCNVTVQSLNYRIEHGWPLWRVLSPRDVVKRTSIKRII